MKKYMYLVLVLSALASIPIKTMDEKFSSDENEDVVSSQEAPQKEESNEMKSVLEQYEKLYQSLYQPYAEAKLLWREFRRNTRWLNRLIYHYKENIGEFADKKTADKLFMQYVPKIKEALEKTEKNIERYKKLPEEAKQVIRDMTSWRPGMMGMGMGMRRGFGPGMGMRPGMVRGFGQGMNMRRGFGPGMGMGRGMGYGWQTQEIPTK